VRRRPHLVVVLELERSRPVSFVYSVSAEDQQRLAHWLSRADVVDDLPAFIRALADRLLDDLDQDNAA
jgi:hypothetical protein